MKKLFALVVLLLVVASSFADTVNVSNATKWVAVDPHHIVLYDNTGRQICLIEIPYAEVSSSSRIGLLDEYIHDGGNIRIDGAIESIGTIQRY